MTAEIVVFQSDGQQVQKEKSVNRKMRLRVENLQLPLKVKNELLSILLLSSLVIEQGPIVNCDEVSLEMRNGAALRTIQASPKSASYGSQQLGEVGIREKIRVPF